MDQPEKTEAAPATPATDSLNDVIKRVNAGDAATLQILRTYLHRSNRAALYLGGDLSYQAMAQLIQSYAGTDAVVREALFQQMNNLRSELCGENKNPVGVERLLIENVVGTWLHLHRLEVLYAAQERPTFHTDSYFQRELSSAHKRYLAAIRTLIDARRRPLPSVQINVANEQINVANEQVNVAPSAAPAPVG